MVNVFHSHTQQFLHFLFFYHQKSLITEKKNNTIKLKFTNFYDVEITIKTLLKPIVELPKLRDSFLDFALPCLNHFPNDQPTDQLLGDGLLIGWWRFFGLDNL